MGEEYKSYVMRGATLVCDKGSHERKVNLIYDHGWGIDVAAIDDENGKQHPFVLSKDIVIGNEGGPGNVQQNISWFGVCSGQIKDSEHICLKKCGSEETVSGAKCMPKILTDWLRAKENIKLGKRNADASPLVANQSYLVCECGGVIKIKDSGAEYDGSKDKTTNAE